jgi:tyrosyl-tRNA synthetase
LAKSIIRDFRDEKEAEEAAEEFDRVHKQKEVPANLETTVIDRVKISDSVETQLRQSLINIIMDLQIFPSRGEAKRVIQQGGVYLDGQRIDDINYQVDITDIREHLLKVGKRKFYKFIVKSL